MIWVIIKRFLLKNRAGLDGFTVHFATPLKNMYLEKKNVKETKYKRRKVSKLMSKIDRVSFHQLDRGSRTKGKDSLASS